jgi:uncharacterized membrane protein YczE
MSDDLESLLDINSASNTSPQPQSNPPLMRSNSANGYAVSLSKRYSNAYQVAFAIVKRGEWLMLVGQILAVLIMIIGLLVYVFLRSEQNNLAMGIFALCVAFFAYGVYEGLQVYGTLTSAQGQMLLASLDTAVNGSPFLTKEQQAEIMNL